MNFKNSIFAGFARFIILLLFIQACTSISLADKQQALCPKCKDPRRYVRLHAWPGVRQDMQGQIAHPIQLSPQDWARVLSDIRIQNSSESFLFFQTKGAASQAFTPDEVDYLGTALSKVLAQAQPSQLAVFGLSRVRSQDLIEVTTGGWYVEGSRVHLLLANYRQSVTMSNILERLWRNPLVSNTPLAFDLVPGEHQKLAKAEKALGGLIKSDIPDLSTDYKLLSGTTGKGGQKAPSMASDGKESSIEQRLQSLNRLKEKGLITEQEFLEKRKKLLEGL